MRSDEVQHERVVELGATRESLGAMHGALDEFWKACASLRGSTVDSASRVAFVTALGETTANVVQHACAGGSLATRVELRLRLRGERVDAVLRDGGRPLGTAPRERLLAAQPVDLEDLPEHGMGLSIIGRAVDRVTYHRTRDGINVWRLEKRLER